ncbi:MAG: hypothetical protein ABIJ12_06050 [bacterium]
MFVHLKKSNKVIIFTTLLLLLAHSAIVFAQANTNDIHKFPILTGPYVGQKPPGSTPELFAPGIISTKGYDITPTFSPELDELFFGSRPTEEGNDNKIYYSNQIDKIWQKPKVASFSSGAMEYEAQFSGNGKTVYFNRNNQLFFSEKTPDGWSEAKNLKPPLSTGMCVAIAGNENIYFTAARSNKYGIFYSERNNNTYEDPELIIPMASHPFVALDESYLIVDKYAFEDGKQVSSLYVCFKDSTGSWSSPVKFGDEINATGTELIAKVSPDGKYLFFQRKINNNTDIYWVDAKIIEDIKMKELIH